MNHRVGSANPIEFAICTYKMVESSIKFGGLQPIQRITESLGDASSAHQMCAEPEGKDQVGGTMEQSALRRAVPLSSTISPNDPEHDDAEGWCKTAKNYTKGRIAELIDDFD
uniref:Uncharacterized protein n=1 Tax=Solanum tuberosum TaxID=4113 RepID=M1DAY1_SOLTU